MCAKLDEKLESLDSFVAMSGLVRIPDASLDERLSDSVNLSNITLGDTQNSPGTINGISRRINVSTSFPDPDYWP